MFSSGIQPSEALTAHDGSREDDAYRPLPAPCSSRLPCPSARIRSVGTDLFGRQAGAHGFGLLLLGKRPRIRRHESEHGRPAYSGFFATWTAAMPPV